MPLLLVILALAFWAIAFLSRNNSRGWPELATLTGFCLLMAALAVIVEDWTAEKKTLASYYDNLRLNVPNKTNWGAFEIYPEEDR